jgi:hypothetical protein
MKTEIVLNAAPTPNVTIDRTPSYARRGRKRKRAEADAKLTKKTYAVSAKHMIGEYIIL